jgi:hypothetical protein
MNQLSPEHGGNEHEHHAYARQQQQRPYSQYHSSQQPEQSQFYSTEPKQQRGVASHPHRSSASQQQQQQQYSPSSYPVHTQQPLHTQQQQAVSPPLEDSSFDNPRLSDYHSDSLHSFLGSSNPTLSHYEDHQSSHYYDQNNQNNQFWGELPEQEQQQHERDYHNNYYNSNDYSNDNNIPQMANNPLSPFQPQPQLEEERERDPALFQSRSMDGSPVPLAPRLPVDPIEEMSSDPQVLSQKERL